MSTSLQELIARRDQIEAELKQMRKEAKKEAI